MGHKNLFIMLLILCSFFLISCETDETTDSETTVNPEPVIDSPDPGIIEEEIELTDEQQELLNRSQAYISLFNEQVNESELVTFLSTFRETCSSDRCVLNSLYQYILTNMTYYDDTRNDYNHRYPQKSLNAPLDIIRTKGGDHEDLSLFFATASETLGYTSYFALTEEHIYALACGIENVDRLETDLTLAFYDTYSFGGSLEDYTMEAIDGKIYLVREMSRSIDIQPDAIEYIGSGGSTMVSPFWRLNMKYVVSADDQVTVHAVSSARMRQFKASENDDFEYYEGCKATGSEINQTCQKMTANGGIILEHDTDETVPAYVKLTHYYRFGQYDQAESVIQPYYINDMTCVIAPFDRGDQNYLGAPALSQDAFIVNPKNNNVQ